jgi:hypothetical protein
MGKQGGQSKKAPAGGHAVRGADHYTGAAGARQATQNGGSFPAAKTPSGGHGSGGGSDFGPHKTQGK